MRKRTRIRLVIVLLGSPSKLTYRQNPEDNDTLIRELVIVFLHQGVDKSANDGVACIVGVHLITNLVNMVKIIVHEVIPNITFNTAVTICHNSVDQVAKLSPLDFEGLSHFELIQVSI